MATYLKSFDSSTREIGRIAGDSEDNIDSKKNQTKNKNSNKQSVIKTQQ